MKGTNLSKRLLAWYQVHARDLPWRYGPNPSSGQNPDPQPDPYRVWLSEIMLQQTTVATVGPYFNTFIKTWPTVTDLAKAPQHTVLSAWAGLGYYSRARNLHACAQKVTHDYGGAFPGEEAELRKLPGIGPYTAAAIAALAFGKPAVVVDGNIERVMTRLYNSPRPIAENKSEIYKWAAALSPKERPGDYAQALMDLGATICRPTKPLCPSCPISEMCEAHKAGRAAALPIKRPKAPKPIRYGHAYLIKNAQGHLLIDRRPARGLLGGMDGLPSNLWSNPAPPVLDGTKDLGIEVRHTFTHFHLHLRLMDGPESLAAAYPEARFVSDLGGLALPTLFKKALHMWGKAR